MADDDLPIEEFKTKEIKLKSILMEPLAQQEVKAMIATKNSIITSIQNYLTGYARGKRIDITKFTFSDTTMSFEEINGT